MARESPRTLLYKIARLQEALNTVNSKTDSTNSQAVAALSRIIQNLEQVTYFANTLTTSLTISSGQGSSVNVINLSAAASTSNVAIANNDRITIVYSTITTSNVTVATGTGSTIAYLNLNHFWANSNVALAVGDQIFVDSYSGVISSLPVTSNSVVITSSTVTGPLTAGVLKVRKVLNNVNTSIVSTLAACTTLIVSPGVQGNLIANTIIITKATPITVYATKSTDVGKTVSSNSGNVFVPAGVHSPGDTIYIHNNNTTSNITVTQNSGVTIYRANVTLGHPANTGNFYVSPKGYVTLICTEPNIFVVSGMGIKDI